MEEKLDAEVGEKLDEEVGEKMEMLTPLLIT